MMVVGQGLAPAERNEQARSLQRKICLHPRQITITQHFIKAEFVYTFRMGAVGRLFP